MLTSLFAAPTRWWRSSPTQRRNTGWRVTTTTWEQVCNTKVFVFFLLFKSCSRRGWLMHANVWLGSPFVIKSSRRDCGASDHIKLSYSTPNNFRLLRCGPLYSQQRLWEPLREPWYTVEMLSRMGRDEKQSDEIMRRGKVAERNLTERNRRSKCWL